MLIPKRFISMVAEAARDAANDIGPLRPDVMNVPIRVMARPPKGLLDPFQRYLLEMGRLKNYGCTTFETDNPKKATAVYLYQADLDNFGAVVETTLHELGHAVAGCDENHGPKWVAACASLGLLTVENPNTTDLGLHHCSKPFIEALLPHLEDVIKRGEKIIEGMQ